MATAYCVDGSGNPCTGVIGSFRVDGIYVPTGTFTSTFVSDVYNAGSDLTSWSTFDIESVLNGQTLTVGARTGTSQANAESRQFKTLADGAQVSTTTTETFVQWKATFTTASGVNSPSIQSIQVNWNEGGAATVVPSAGFVNDRYWIAAATGSTGNKNSILVKSKNSDNFTLFTGSVNFNGFVKFENNYYAIDSTGSSIYQIEEGEMDNGTTIYALWESRDETWGLPMNYKNLQELFLDYEGAPSTRVSTMSYSLDSGNTFTDIYGPDLAGTGRQGARVYVESVNGRSVRHRITARNLDKPITIYGLDSIARPLKIR